MTCIVVSQILTVLVLGWSCSSEATVYVPWFLFVLGLPFVSPDGKHLFFTGAEPGQVKGPGPGVSDIYWVSARIIDELRAKE